MAEQLQGLGALALGGAEAGHVGEAHDVADRLAFGVSQQGGGRLQDAAVGRGDVAGIALGIEKAAPGRLAQGLEQQGQVGVVLQTRAEQGFGPVVGQDDTGVRVGYDRGVGQASQGVGDEALQIAHLAHGGAQGVHLTGDDIAALGAAGQAHAVAFEGFDLALHIGRGCGQAAPAPQGIGQGQSGHGG
ncbi:hypothetical protein D3C73_988770 [compost metagenome]